MSKTKFTEGDWDARVSDESDDGCVFISSGLKEIAVIDFSKTTKKKVVANAKLMAQSKNMYRLLEDISKSNCRTQEFCDDIEALLAKARG